MSEDHPSRQKEGEHRYEQALRFLVALHSQQNQDRDAQRRFLESKGLTDDEITKAFEESKRPETLQSKRSHISHDTNNKALEGLSDQDAFDTAARMFEDPLHVEQHETSPSVPPKTYPRSPLALYQAQTQVQPSSIDNPLTRYHVLLRFFRSLCYGLVLGGGVASVVVALYRAYVIPRLVATLDARSTILKHHRELYESLSRSVNGLRVSSLALLKGEKLDTSSARKGVLKKVQFADQVDHEKLNMSGEIIANTDDEDKKESGEKKAIADPDSERESAQGQTDAPESQEASDKVSALPSVDILDSWRTSLTRLNQTLKADTSASAIGTDIVRPDLRSTGKSSVPATTVEEESDAESWISEDDSEELEFDPFASHPPPSKHKHSPKSALGQPSTISSQTSASVAAATSLKSSLNGMNAYLNTQTYMAGARSLGSGGASFGTLGAGSSGGSASNSKVGDVAQVRAEIRSLKGLLLSRCVSLRLWKVY